MSVELMSKINDNYLLACCVHKEMADLCWFGGYMSGYAMLHEYQLLSETLTQRKIKRYITSTYNVFAPDRLPKSANITEPLLLGKNRKSLKMEDVWKIIKESFRIYQDWEESSLKLYQEIAAELMANGDVAAFNFVAEIIKDVKAELVYVTDFIISLNGMDWDMPTIVDQQVSYTERFEYKIRTLLGKSDMGHHYNSFYDVESRLSVLDKKE